MRKLIDNLQPMQETGITFSLPVLALERFLTLDSLAAAKSESFDVAVQRHELRQALLQPAGTEHAWDWDDLARSGLALDKTREVQSLTLTRRDLKALREFLKEAVVMSSSKGDGRDFDLMELYERVNFALGA